MPDAARIRPLVVTLALAFAARAAAAEAPRALLGTPAATHGDSVLWRAIPPVLPAWAAGLVLPPANSADSLALWTAASRDSLIRPLALLTLGQLRLARGDTLGADSALGAAAARNGLWAWRALQSRAGLWQARGRLNATDSLLAAADRTGWPDADRAAWLLQRMRLRGAIGDTVQAETFARQLVRIYPTLGQAPVALAELEYRVTQRRDSLSYEDERAGAEVEWARGDRAAAERRLTRVLRLADSTSASAVARRLAEARRGLRRFAAARAALDLALAAARNDSARADARLELARTWRDQGVVDSVFTAYDAAIAVSPDSARRESFAWEAAREAEDGGHWEAARERFTAVARLGRARAGDAAFRIGLMHFILGRADSAGAWWANGASEPETFWRAVALRARARAAGTRAARHAFATDADTLLKTLAARPGYGFYRSAARDSLGVRGWPRVRIAVAAETPEPALAIARALASVGAASEAPIVLSRWLARDPRLAALTTARAAEPATLLDASEIAYAAGHVPLGIACAERAARSLEDSTAARAWSVVPWAYPPAFDSLVRARPAGVPPELIWAITRQESRFDPRARSSSNALGLMQLKLETAADAARRAHERMPKTDEDLFDPELNVRLGTAYLRQMLDRFDGRLGVALSAYNAGPGTIPPFWRDLIARGGEALFCEIASNADAQDYTRKILANRAAYRELRPSARRR